MQKMNLNIEEENDLQSWEKPPKKSSDAQDIAWTVAPRRLANDHRGTELELGRFPETSHL